MKKLIYTFLATFVVLAFTEAAQAQLKLPQPSPEAFVKQTIGLTDISISYHAPGVKGRKIFGSLVPYGQLWRAGANEATVIKFSDDLFLNNERVPAGAYSVFILPESDSSWNLILNKDTTLWGLEGYNELDDVAYLRIKPQATSFNETMQFNFTDVGLTTGNLNLVWENSKVTVRIETEVEKKALANIKKALAEASADDWYIWAQSADYMMQKKEYHELALQWINKSIAIKENFYNNWVKARLYAYNKEFQMAASLSAKAIQLGGTDPQAYKTYAKEIETAYNDWKKRKF
ncbi:DUF2911 domain-containing protein [Pontibacter sp. SGAir0037]|uniref:DUF2911 domain-containing protein n=1 Tax=Pontibacter sp. SGAir0037 TaxID=2571030 RepID=UPI0010CD2649|nr:DUF2911 domain-containing protein [Pontibacter sp. SGAir0037]QCR22008.1 hypothetical protein C1N53_06435 [Pontibacter sp. SGAir0037]